MHATIGRLTITTAAPPRLPSDWAALIAGAGEAFAAYHAREDRVIGQRPVPPPPDGMRYCPFCEGDGRFGDVECFRCEAAGLVPDEDGERR